METISVETLSDPTAYSYREVSVMCEMAALLMRSLPKRGGRLVVVAPPDRDS